MADLSVINLSDLDCNDCVVPAGCTVDTIDDANGCNGENVTFAAVRGSAGIPAGDTHDFRSYPALYYCADGTYYPADVVSHNAGLSELYEPPDTGIRIPSQTSYTMTSGLVNHDIGGMTAGGATITIQRDGIYYINSRAVIADLDQNLPATSGMWPYVMISPTINGNELMRGNVPFMKHTGATRFTHVTAHGVRRMNAGDVIGVVVWNLTDFDLGMTFIAMDVSEQY